jgi:hypothetical protein
VATTTTSLEAHRPTTSSDNVSFASWFQLFFLISFSHYFILQILMQKFLSLGNECVKIQETADASQGMFTMVCAFFFSHVCSFCLPLAIDCLLAPLYCVVAALTSARARISSLEAKLRASQ